jgi:hypothetical protein
VQRFEPLLLVLRDPARGDLVNRDGVQVVQLLAPAADSGHEVGGLEDREVLRDRLARHFQVRAEVRERLPVTRAQRVEQAPPRRTGQGTEDGVHRSRTIGK